MITNEKELLEVLENTNFAVPIYFTVSNMGIDIIIRKTWGLTTEGRFYFNYGQTVSIELWSNLDSNTSKQMLWLYDTSPIEQVEQLIEKLKTVIRFFKSTSYIHTEQFKTSRVIKLDNTFSWETDFTNELEDILNRNTRSLSHHLHIIYKSNNHNIFVALCQDVPEVDSVTVLDQTVTPDNYREILNKLNQYVTDFEKKYPSLGKLYAQLSSKLENL